MGEPIWACPRCGARNVGPEHHKCPGITWGSGRQGVMEPLPSGGSRQARARASVPTAGQRRESVLLDYSAAAEYLATTERHVRDLWNRRQVAAVKVGRLVRFRRVDLDAYIERNRTEAV